MLHRMIYKSLITPFLSKERISNGSDVDYQQFYLVGEANRKKSTEFR